MLRAPCWIEEKTVKGERAGKDGFHWRCVPLVGGGWKGVEAQPSLSGFIVANCNIMTVLRIPVDVVVHSLSTVNYSLSGYSPEGDLPPSPVSSVLRYPPATHQDGIPSLMPREKNDTNALQQFFLFQKDELSHFRNRFSGKSLLTLTVIGGLGTRGGRGVF